MTGITTESAAEGGIRTYRHRYGGEYERRQECSCQGYERSLQKTYMPVPEEQPVRDCTQKEHQGKAT